TARCDEFREYEGRHRAVLNLVRNGIDRLVTIGGDGSLAGSEEFQDEWPQHIRELRDEGEISDEDARRHEYLRVVGLVGSIDNDLVGTD
ncbi:UNVERIFIED_CONTAM: 6-phosphofructokinase, partial [Bacillus sp. ATCC 13368]